MINSLQTERSAGKRRARAEGLVSTESDETNHRERWAVDRVLISQLAGPVPVVELVNREANAVIWPAMRPRAKAMWQSGLKLRPRTRFQRALPPA